MLVKQVLSHGSMSLGGDQSAQAAGVVSQLLHGLVAVVQEVLLQEVTELRREVREEVWGEERRGERGEGGGVV